MSVHFGIVRRILLSWELHRRAVYYLVAQEMATFEVTQICFNSQSTCFRISGNITHCENMLLIQNCLSLFIWVVEEKNAFVDGVT